MPDLGSLLGVCAVRAAAGVAEKCAIPAAGKEDLELGQSDLQQECTFVPPCLSV